MSLYFDTQVKFKEGSAITTNATWHPASPLLAVASYSQERGGFVSIFDELGEPLSDIEPPWHPIAQVTALLWNPERQLLAVGWEDGALRLWDTTTSGFTTIPAPHSAPLTLLGFSEKGGRAVSADSTGSLVGWKVDNRNQLFTAFHHDLKDPITHIVFRQTINNKAQLEMENLAKAAVNGDEQALDLFSSWRPRTAANKMNVRPNSVDNYCFFIGTQAGIVYYVNQTGQCTEVLNTEGQPLMNILYHPTKDSLIIMMEGLNVGHFAVDSNGNLTELVKIKLSGKSQAFRGANNQGLIWAGGELLAILTGEMTVRIWDIENNDNYTLPVSQSSNTDEDSSANNAIFTCITYCKVNNILCAGTNLGQIYFWSRVSGNPERFLDNPESLWTLKSVNHISGTVKQLFWGSVNMVIPLLAVNCITKVFILKEQTLNTCYSERFWATQKNANEILLCSEKENTTLKSEIQISCISIDKDTVAVSNGKMVIIYEIALNENIDVQKSNKDISTLNFKQTSTFQCDNELIFVYEKKIIALTPMGIFMKSINGIPISNIATISNEGEPIGIDLNKQFLTVFTMNGFIKIYDLSKGEPKLHARPKNLYDICTNFGEIINAKSNCNGTKIAFTIASASLIPDQKLYVLDVENDALRFLNFTDEDFEENDTEDVDVDAKMLKENRKICTSRVPIRFFWDYNDERLLITNARKLKVDGFNNHNGLKLMNGSIFTDINNSTYNKLIDADNVIITIFVSPQNDIFIKDIQEISIDGYLIALHCPYIILLENGSISRKLITGFEGIDNHTETANKALLDFSYYLSLGNIDAAIQAIRLLPNGSSAWRNLACVCVSTGRVDVARVCLGQMGAVREVKALRQAMEDSTLEREAVIAMLAIQLDLLDEAEQLYKKCKRYDLLNKLYQARNKFPEAMEVAKQFDRIHVKSTAYAWAKYLESTGNISDAIAKYELAGCHRDNVPRMLLDRPKELEEYIQKTGDKELQKWWGQYMESTGDIMRRALLAYEAAGDTFSQVRVLCFSEQEEQAAQIARSSSDRAASYHIARYYEANDDIDNAVAFFAKAQAYSNAVRLCKEHNMSDEMWNISTMAGKRDKMECAKYFENINEMDKAILLYHQSGMTHKAIDLSFKTKQYDSLQIIATDLDMNSDPVLIEKCAKFFIDHERYDKAVDLLAVGKKYIEALEICLKHNVQVTEELAERLTPDKEQVDPQIRVSVLEKLAESLQVQGNYHLATKKFTQAGDKVRAMKSLLKSGDTEKIVFFANVSRQKEIYIMAANYLQSLDWQNQPNVLRNIITFYSKGKAMDLLSNFYVACAQVEIDEFQNYEKAMGALTEASRALSKVTNPKDLNQHQKATDIINAQMSAIKRFIDVRRFFEKGDIANGMAQSRQLLDSSDQHLDKYVRRGDIYAIMIQHALSSGNISDAKDLFIELRQYLSQTENVNLTYYLSGDILQLLAKGLGVSMNALIPSKNDNENEDQDEQEIEEEVES